MAVTLVVSVLAITSPAESNLSQLRKQETVHIIPGSVVSENWHNSASALVRDVDENGVYQSFTRTNSAYFDGSVPTLLENVLDNSNQSSGGTHDAQDSDFFAPGQIESPIVDEEIIEGEEIESGEETIDESQGNIFEEVEAEPDVVSIPEPVNPEPAKPEGISLRDLSIGFLSFTQFARVPMLLVLESTKEFFTQENVESPQTPPEPIIETEETPVVDFVEQEVIDTLEDTVLDENETIVEIEGTSPIPEQVTDREVSASRIDSSIIFEDFTIPQLKSGQFIRNMQLRMSLGALLKSVPDDLLPSINVSYSFGDVWESAGMVLVDGEVSNALNGGDFLFALPKIQQVKQLDNFSVRVSYNGEIEIIENIFIDAVWLEIDTEIFDRELLKARLNPQELSHLKLPQIHSLLSADLDFTREDLPRFSMRYESQRNVAVKFIRDFFGRTLASVEHIAVSHVNTQDMVITPEVNVTADGLITVQLSEDDTQDMRPGEYEVEIVINEGGKIFTDTFSFQWGMLAINPDQAEYQIGDTAHISLGAITRNGNTICDATLQLYVIDPLEYISEVDVQASGLCSGNNVIDVPDYSASLNLETVGEYTLYVERLNENGEVLSHTNDTFHVVDSHDVALKRVGPTRIYPPAPYPMHITLTATTSFDGVLIERVPVSFAVFDTEANISEVGEFHELSWNVSLASGESQTFSYNFDAPDLSPYLYLLGPARLEAESRTRTREVVVSTLDTMSSPEETTEPAVQTVTETVGGGVVYEEHRRWQIASDATGNMLLLWDGGAAPAGWTCVSCNPGEPFYQRFIMGSSTYNSVGGAATHTHTGSGVVFTSSNSTKEDVAGTSISAVSHTHTLTPTISSASNLPTYRQLRVIQYTASAGEPANIPNGAIGIFDGAIPTGWTQYNIQNGYYIRGENTVGTTGGSNTHTHTVTGTTGAAGGGTFGNRGANAGNAAAPAGHTHTISTSTGSESNEPPYIEVMLAQINATAPAPNGLIAMWTEDVPGSWLDVSTSGSEAFSNRFIKPSASYGATSGASSHSHSDITGITSSAPIQAGVTPARNGTGGSDITHTHQVNVTGISNSTHLPPYVTVIFGKRQGNIPVFTQQSYRWYANTNAQTPTDPWPIGGTDLVEAEPITATSTPLKFGDVVRLRMNVSVLNATATVASTTFKLQYASSTATCSAISTWYDVGSSTSTVEWRGFNNTSVSDHSTLSTPLLSSTTVLESYEENGYTNLIPNQIPIAGVGEWDFVLQQNGAYPGVEYCFRLVGEDGSPFNSYNTYPSLFTNYAPVSPTPTKLFDNEKTASTSPWFEFVSSDPELNDVTYQVQIDNDFDFSSTVANHNSESNGELFDNLLISSDKDPFNSGQLMRYKTSATLSNGVTYWWRVRAKDPSGSNQWGDWSTPYSFTIDTALTATAWHQTTEEQFETNILVGVEAVGSDQVQLISGSTTGSMTTGAIDFNSGALGTAWDSLSWNDTETTGDIAYSIEYYDGVVWSLIPNTVLPGNSAGFDTSPVSLLDLDTSVYSLLRVIANFTNSGGSPSLQDITVSWGYRVPTPTITRLFANEKVGTTTPVFQFVTSDAQNDSLTYQISWSVDNTFTSSTTRTSDTHPGFINSVQGIDLDPFNSGNAIQFTVQSGDALTNGSTYWWRVRAKDTTGDNAYSLWTTPRSFTVDTAVTVSTWFQTTRAQFESDILSGTIPLTSDVLTVATTATEAMLVYGEGIQTQPRYRQWNGSVWSSEGTLSSIDAPLRWAVVKAGATREEYIAVTIGTDADVNAQVFSLGEWGNLQEMTTSLSDVTARGIDVAYETLSGDAMVVYCDGDADPSYYIWDGSSWTSGGTINLASTNNCSWIKLASDPVSDEIILTARDSVGTGAASYEVQVWNGASWGNSTTQGGARGAAYETMALEYEESGGQALSVSGDGNPARFEYNSWNGSAWAGLTTFAVPDNLMWAQLVRDDGSDNMALCYIDESEDIGVVRWTGSAWTGQTTLDAAGNSVADRAVSCVYETTSGRDGNIMAVYSDTTNARYQVWNGATWSAEASVSTITDSATVQSIRTGTGAILAMFFDDVNDRYDFSYWDGSSWSTAQTLETNASVDASPFGEPFMMAARNPGRTGTVVAAPPIAFTDGVGPYWEEMSWVDTTPGTSDILYSMQYYDTNTSSWQFIPNSDLPGNESGFTTSPVDLSGLSIATYSLIRPYAELTCDGLGNCPSISDWTVEWAGGITVSGTLMQYDQVSSTTAGTIAVAVNGVLQVGKTGSVSNGVWAIDNVTTFPGDIVTVFVSGASDASEAVGVTRYDGIGDITGLSLYERHLALGSNDATTTPLTNSDIGLYDNTNNEDLFHDVTGTTLTVCAETICGDARIRIKGGTFYQPNGSLITHDFENKGTFIANGNTVTIGGSWYNNATATLATSTIIFSATSTGEVVDATGATNNTFFNLTFGTTTGSATWTVLQDIDVDNNLTVAYGTLARAERAITVAGNLSTGASGFWSGLGTTTFDGSLSRTWSDANATKQDVGNVVIDGTSKIITLASDVRARSVRIGADDVLDASTAHYDITVLTDWINTNTFVPRNGEVFMSATTTGRIVTTGGSPFYDVTFNGSGGAWSFTEANLSVNNNLTISAGTLTMPTGTTTIAGSFSSSGGTFAHNNATVSFTGSGAKTITVDGGPFTNAFYNLRFSGTGPFSITDAHATTSENIFITQGTVTFPSNTLNVGGNFLNTGGTFAHNNGTVRFISSGPEIIDTNASFNNLAFTGSGSWSFVDASVTALGNLTTTGGTVTLPSNTLSLGGSFINTGTVSHNNGTVLFNSTDTGETINLGNSSLYNMTFNSLTGGWTIATHATTTNNFTLTNTSNFTLTSGQTLSVGGVFTNATHSASTTWTGSILSLEAGDYSINSKTNSGDTYGTLRVRANTDIKMWNSSADTYVVDSSGSLYSQDHSGVDGALYIFGSYERTSGNEYWSYATDFDGASASRQAEVYFADGASATLRGALFEILGVTSASTTIQNQGSGTYVVGASSTATRFNFYDFDNLGTTGVTLTGAGTVISLNDGALKPSVSAGTGFTIASSTINANPALQIYRVEFATTSAISAYNVAQTDGTPTSYWWFRQSSGNLDGEAFDNDTGDPGSIRWDDSSLVITVSGTVYSDDGITPMGNPTCDDVTQNIRIVIQNGASYTGSCASADGSFSIANVVVVADPVVTVYLDTNGGARGTVVTRTPTADITDLNIYQNRVMTRHEDVEPMTILKMAVYDFDDDSDIAFTAATGTLTVFANTELRIASSTTFAPGGDITIHGNASSTAFDGSLHIDNNATFTGSGTSTYSIAGSFTMDEGATFTSASTTVLMNATTTGKTITTSALQEIIFNNLEFNGVGGGWNINGDIRAIQDIDITLGTVSGTADITVVNGSLSGNGLLSMGAGTTTINRTNTLGGTTAWTFANLVLGNGSVTGTTTPGSNATTTILGKLTINTAHYLDAGASLWNLAGTGNVFVENGTFLEDTSTLRYSGIGATNILSTSYYNLDLKAQGGSPTYTGTGLGIIVHNNLTIGGATTTLVTLDTIDPALDVNGNITIDTTGTLIGSASAPFTVAGNWDNNGVYTASGGTVTFDTAGASSVYAGNSAFANVVINGTGTFTIAEHATATSAFTLTNASSFTVTSGQTLAVGGAFTNTLGGGVTTWAGSTLFLYGGGNYQINASSTSDTYGILSIGNNTQIRMWNSEAGAYDMSSTGSLYSQDHENVTGDLYIYGAYAKTSGTDYWNYTTDFDGTNISGSPRVANVYIQGGSTILYTGGGLSVLGTSGNATVIQNQGSGTYSFRIGGTSSTTWSYYDMQDMDSGGLTFSGTPTVTTLSYGDITVSANGGSAMTVGGTVITQNPAKTFTENIFATTTAISAFNVTATGTANSSWRFTNHSGNLAGEEYDVDPDGNPGYIVWDNSSSTITISGVVYSDEGVTPMGMGVCDGSTASIHLRVAGLTSYTTSCAVGTGAYSISGVNYSPGDALIVYIDGETEKAATVTEDPISNINNLDLYQNRVIVRHEGVDPLTIADMAIWDSSDDPDIPFTAVDASPDTLTLPANRKLIVWNSKTFRPNGNVTVSGGGAGADYDGTLELYTNAIFDATGSETHTIGGSLISGAGASIDDETSTFIFTTTGAGRTIDTNNNSFYNVTLNGTGSWIVTNTTLDIGNDFTITQGAITLPSATTTITGSLSVTGGSFDANGGTMVFNGGSSEIIRPRTSSFGNLVINGTGSFSIQGGNATTTGDVRIIDGSFTSATGTFAIGGNFINNDTFLHGSGALRFTSGGTVLVTARNSDLYTTNFVGGGTYTFTDTSVALLGNLTIENGAVTLATGTMAIGGSFLNTGGSFNNASGTILFNSSDTGETVNPGNSPFHTVAFASAGGGWTITANATTTGNFSLTSATNFTVSSSTTLYVGGVFTNLVGGGATTWTGSTLVINSGTSYTINTKAAGGDIYNNIYIGSSTALRAWDSAGIVTMTDGASSFYSQDHAGVSGHLYVYGNYVRDTGSDYWSYATDFDGTALGGGSRQAYVYMESGATTTFTGGSLNIIGANGFDTTISNQGNGTYAMDIRGGTFNALYYSFANMNSRGLVLSGLTSVSSLTEGNFTLAVNGGSLITLSSTTLNYNAGLFATGVSFATTTAITGTNVELIGTTPSAWTFIDHTGNLAGENYDIDGGDACGSIRWDDSGCVLIAQSAYRFRNDDGGEGVPNSEWYDLDWGKRQRVTITNVDPVTYINSAIKLTVSYDSDMQTDFDDLRFTDSDGLTPIEHFIESYTASTQAVVWVKVPTLATSTKKEVYMYYSNGGVGDASATSTFSMIDTFEDGNITEYSGDTGEFVVSGTGAYERTYRLNAADPVNGKTDFGGMYNNGYAVSQGQKLRFFKYIDTGAGSSDEVCTLFGTQNQTQNYAVCLELFGVDRLSLARNVLHRDTSGTVLASTTVTYATGWYEVEVDWRTNNSIFVTLSKDGSLVATTSATDATYTTGGIGYTLWGYHGGWDIYSARPLLETEPTVSFGFEQVPGGATWAAPLNTPTSGVDINESIRVRFLVENGGTPVTAQNYEIEFAPKGNAPSCESVDYNEYVEVPPVASCGVSDICMQSSSQITNLESTTDLLGGTGVFVSGQVVEDPSNNTGDIDVDSGEYTELEYVITPTTNVTDSNFCLRVTNEGVELDAYSRVAELSLTFAPNITTLWLNGGMDITLVGGSTTTVMATGTVSDGNGYTDLVGATTTIFRSGVGESCSADNNNCYIAGNSLCSFVNCSGNSCDIECSVDMYYHADPTDIGTYAAETWRAHLAVRDASGSVATATAPSIDLITLRAISVNDGIDYGTLEVNADTGSYNASTTVENIGNTTVDLDVEGTDLTDGGSSAIPVSGQKFATSTFTYSACTVCSVLDTTPVNININLSKPVSTTPKVTDEIFWGIAVPFGVAGTPHQGFVTFTPIPNVP